MRRRVVRDPKTGLVTEISQEEAELEAEVEGVIKLVNGFLSSLANALWQQVFGPFAQRWANASYRAGVYKGAKDQATADHAAVKLAAEEGARSAAKQVAEQVGGAMFERGVRAGAAARMEEVCAPAVQLGHESVVRRLAAFLAVLSATPPSVAVGDPSRKSPLSPAEEEAFALAVAELAERLDDKGRLDLEIALEDYQVGQLGDLGLLERLADLEQQVEQQPDEQPRTPRVTAEGSVHRPVYRQER